MSLRVERPGINDSGNEMGRTAMHKCMAMTSCHGNLF